jgi:hypothetical protein
VSILLYGTESCDSKKNDVNSLDVSVNRFPMALFKMNNLSLGIACSVSTLSYPAHCWSRALPCFQLNIILATIIHVSWLLYPLTNSVYSVVNVCIVSQAVLNLEFLFCFFIVYHNGEKEVIYYMIYLSINNNQSSLQSSRHTFEAFRYTELDEYK